MYQGHTYILPLIVQAGDGPTILGHDWLQHIQLDWLSMFQTKTVKDDSLQHSYYCLLSHYSKTS